MRVVFQSYVQWDTYIILYSSKDAYHPFLSPQQTISQKQTALQNSLII